MRKKDPLLPRSLQLGQNGYFVPSKIGLFACNPARVPVRPFGATYGLSDKRRSSKNSLVSQVRLLYTKEIFWSRGRGASHDTGRLRFLFLTKVATPRIAKSPISEIVLSAKARHRTVKTDASNILTERVFSNTLATLTVPVSVQDNFPLSVRYTSLTGRRALPLIWLYPPPTSRRSQRSCSLHSDIMVTRLERNNDDSRKGGSSSGGGMGGSGTSSGANTEDMDSSR